MTNKPKFFWTPKDGSPEQLEYEDALKLKDAAGDSAIELARHGHADTPDGEIYVISNKHSLFQWPKADL